MFSTVDTIVAIATPAGRGGIGIVRMSGSQAQRIAGALLDRREPLAPRHATFARLVPAGKPAPAITCHQPAATAGPSDRAIDQIIATSFPAPASYTGEDVVEISAHGSPVILRAIVDAAVAAGARLAEPGEFTLRAFLNGRIDLVQAEAVGDLIDAVTPRQARAAFDQLDGTLTREIAALDAALFDLIARLEASLDFPDEGYHFVKPDALASELATLREGLERLLASAGQGRLIREGLQAVILGRPNVGKSTLFNTLVGTGRAIVATEPGTTRDLLTETVEMEGLRVRLVDTAGLREAGSLVEAEGVGRARQAAGIADLQLIVLDASEPLEEEDRRLICGANNLDKLFIINKIDRNLAWPSTGVQELNGKPQIAVSLLSGEGVENLRGAVAETIGSIDQSIRSDVRVTNARHARLLARAREMIETAEQAVEAAGGALSEEFVLQDLHAARAVLEEIRGRRASEELLQHIFSRFCIGK